MTLGIVRAGVRENDGCQVLTKLKAFIVDQGMTPTLEHTFVDADGLPLDLSAYELPDSLSDDETVDQVVLRIAPVSVLGGKHCRVTEVVGEIYDAADGVVRAQLPSSVTDVAGIYELSWGFHDGDNQLLAVNNSLLSVERSLFGPANKRGQGPLTLQEIRLSIRDNHSADNLLLDDVEFDAPEILQAIVRPVRYWNEVPPPLRKIDVDCFPYREHWLRAVQSHLFQLAADHYRREALAYSAGGVAVDDKNKEREYTLAAERLRTQWELFVKQKKVSINVRGAWGRIDTW